MEVFFWYSIWLASKTLTAWLHLLGASMSLSVAASWRVQLLRITLLPWVTCQRRQFFCSLTTAERRIRTGPCFIFWACLLSWTESKNFTLIFTGWSHAHWHWPGENANVLFILVFCFFPMLWFEMHHLQYWASFRFIFHFTQVFSCISRALNTNNALSLPKMQRICNDAYRTKSVVSHTVLTNNFAWQDWLAPHVIPKTLMAAGITKVSSQRILS